MFVRLAFLAVLAAALLLWLASADVDRSNPADPVEHGFGSALDDDAEALGQPAAHDPVTAAPAQPRNPVRSSDPDSMRDSERDPAEATGQADVASAAEMPATPTIEPHRPGVALFYFFSPDWRPPDLGKLTVSVENALAAGGVDVSFQAFNRYEDFERQVLKQPPVFMIAPAWVEGEIGNALGLERSVIARPLRRGKSSYRKALMTRSNIDSIDDLARGSIAATLHSMGAGDPAAVLDAFHLAADSARIVPVPKDVDALLALNFGQVDAALVTSEQYEVLARTSPAEAERMRVLAFSNEVGLPPVFASADADPALAQRLRDVLGRLVDVPDGSAVLGMLGFDGFAAQPPGAAAAGPRIASEVEAPTRQPEPEPRAAKAMAPARGPKPIAKSAPPAKKTDAASATSKP